MPLDSQLAGVTDAALAGGDLWEGQADSLAYLVDRSGLEVRSDHDSFPVLERPRWLYCSTKPIVALAAAGLLERHGLDPMTVRISHEGKFGVDDGWLFSELISHRVPFLDPGILGGLALPPPSRDQGFQVAIQQSFERYGADYDQLRDGRYSETLAWYLLELGCSKLMRADLGLSLTNFLSRGPSRFNIEFRGTDGLMALDIEDMAFAWRRQPDGRCVPLLDSITRRCREGIRPCMGGFGPPSALLDWYLQLRSSFLGEPVRQPLLFPSQDTLHRMIAADRHGDFGAGLMFFGSAAEPEADPPLLCHDGGGGSIVAGLDLAERTGFVIVRRIFMDGKPRWDRLVSDVSMVRTAAISSC